MVDEFDLESLKKLQKEFLLVENECMSEIQDILKKYSAFLDNSQLVGCLESVKLMFSYAIMENLEKEHGDKTSGYIG